MFVKRNIPLGLILKFAYKNLLIFIAYSTIWVLLHRYFHHCGIHILIPFAPVSVIGIAVSFYLGFKNNQAYDRFWEARSIWGSIVNISRNWSNQCLQYVQNPNNSLSSEELLKIKQRLIYRHLAFINALRLHLRKPSSFSIDHKGSIKEYHMGNPEVKNWEAEVKPFLSDAEYEELKSYQNVPTQILKNQGNDITSLQINKMIDLFNHIEMMNTIKDLYNEQGKCERIKNTPFPRQFAYFSKIFVWIFILILPLALTSEFDKLGHGYIWLVVPFSTLISWIYITIEIVGDNSEDPFENFINDVPMTTLCRNIEIDLKEMLNERNIPEKITPKDGILM